MPGSSLHPFSVLIIGELGGRRAEIANALMEPEFTLLQAKEAAEAKALIRSNQEISVILVDHAIPARGCYEILSYVQANSLACQTIVYSRKPGVFDAMETTRRGAFWFLPEPFELEQLLFLVSKACIVYELNLSNQILKNSLSVPERSALILGESKPIQDVLQKADRIAPLDTNVLLTGESGTGKTTLAHYIHQRNTRKSGPFISVSCAAIPRDLLESELFGHEKGAFTGATSQRTGAIELADGGTLFLDEIGDLPLELQPKLLTFLQDRMVRRVGSSKTRQVDVRIITATHRDLKQMCLNREFREDLLFRINVLSIELPPLRKHSEDIPSLVSNILNKISEKREIKPFTVDRVAVELLKSYSWPGNIRELENVLERATAWSNSSKLTVQDFELIAPKDSSKITEIITPENSSSSYVGMTLAEIERKAILETLAHCDGNKAAAAKMLGVSLKTIYNKLGKTSDSHSLEHTSIKIS